MLKYLIVAAAVFSLGPAALCAAEMALPGVAPNAASAETDAGMGGARDDASFGSALHAATERGADGAHARPADAATEAGRAFPGADNTSNAERRHHAHWQSLLPGVMR